ncbi:MAG: ATP synthase subunit C [Candidatus Hydrothermarchaeota archaeon]
MKRMLKGIVILNAFLILFLICTIPVLAQGEEKIEELAVGDGLKSLGIAIGIGLSAGLACTGAGIGVGTAGSAALGAIAEKREMVAWSLVMVGLAEGVALYGLAVAFILMGKL